MTENPRRPIPYLDTPATIHDVTGEMTELIRMVAISVAPTLTDEERQDAENQAAIAQAKTAVALESWLGNSQQELGAMVVAGLEQPLLDRLTGLHEGLHSR